MYIAMTSCPIRRLPNQKGLPLIYSRDPASLVKFNNAQRVYKPHSFKPGADGAWYCAAPALTQRAQQPACSLVPAVVSQPWLLLSPRGVGRYAAITGIHQCRDTCPLDACSSVMRWANCPGVLHRGTGALSAVELMPRGPICDCVPLVLCKLAVVHRIDAVCACHSTRDLLRDQSQQGRQH